MRNVLPTWTGIGAAFCTIVPSASWMGGAAITGVWAANSCCPTQNYVMNDLLFNWQVYVCLTVFVMKDLANSWTDKSLIENSQLNGRGSYKRCMGCQLLLSYTKLCYACSNIKQTGCVPVYLCVKKISRTAWPLIKNRPRMIRSNNKELNCYVFLYKKISLAA